MASIYPDEWLDTELGIFPKGGAIIPTVYMGLFTSQSASTVPSRSATGGAIPNGWTEAAGVNYQRIAIASTAWGPNTTNGNGRRTTAPKQTWPTAGAGGWGTVNGFFLATRPSSQAGDIIIYFANFDDGLSETVNANTTFEVTPSIQKNGN